MKRMKVFCLVSLLLAAIVSLNGCAPVIIAAAGAGGTYLSLKAVEKRVVTTQAFDYDFQTIWQASLETAQEMGISLKEREIKKAKALGTIKGATERYKNITVRVEALAPQVTRVEVKVRDEQILGLPVSRTSFGPDLEAAILMKLGEKLTAKEVASKTGGKIAVSP